MQQYYTERTRELCQQLNNDIGLDELYHIAQQLQFPPNIEYDKRILCEYITSILGNYSEFNFNIFSHQQLNISNRGLRQLNSNSPQWDSIRYLDCSYNQLTELPPLPKNLLSLICNDNQLTDLPPLPPTLKVLYCGNNPLEELPPLPPTLRTLNCINCELSNLPQLPPTLTELSCYGNNLKYLPYLPPSMSILNVRNNKLIELPPLPTSLRLLDTENNNLPYDDEYYLQHLGENYINRYFTGQRNVKSASKRV